MHWRAAVALAVSLAAACLGLRPASAQPKNMFSNPSFEMGRAGWRMDKGGKTVASYAADRADAADGQHSGLVTIGSAEEWGAQFGQSAPAGRKGRTYTFAVLAKAVTGSAPVSLQIERSAKPYDRAAKAGIFTLRTDRWTELHVTFRVEKDFPQGWFAYVSCAKPARFRVDMFRLYEGAYTPYKEAARRRIATTRAPRRTLRWAAPRS